MTSDRLALAGRRRRREDGSYRPSLPVRHDLVWLVPGWRRALASPLEGAVVPAIAAWIAAGRPAVACRRDGAVRAQAEPAEAPPAPQGAPNEERGSAASADLERAGEEPGFARRRAEAKPKHRRSGGREGRSPECPPVETARLVALGIALPPGAPVRRAALLVGCEAVARVAPPLALAEALASAPASWRGRLGALDREARLAGLTLRAYGSLAWQHLSGAPYLTERSDVDLAVAPRGPGELRRALRLLAAHGTEAAPRLDGEILLPGGGGVAWRELAARPERVLVKSLDGVALERTRDALGPLAEGLS